MVSATVPTEEEIAMAIYMDRNGRGCVPWSRRDAAHKAPYLSDARAVLALFAPALAEKEREARENYQDALAYAEAAKKQRLWKEDAEAALAEERERCAKVAEESMTNDAFAIAAAIRAGDR